jgi:hypothetical protein
MAKEQISELQPMKSGAGWYAGTLYLNEEFNCWLPYDRESHYMASEEEVIEYIKVFYAKS